MSRAIFYVAFLIGGALFALSTGSAVYESRTLPEPAAIDAEQALFDWSDHHSLVIPAMSAVPAPKVVHDHGAMPAPDGVFLELGIPFVGRWEGLRLEAYLDRIARPPVWTVCYGKTKGIGSGDVFTKAQCDTMLSRELLSYRRGLHKYFTATTKSTLLPAARDVAYVSLAYNAGIGGAGKSTATRRLNAGDVAGGCSALTWWNKAGGRVVRGLTNRRSAEFDLCMQGVSG